MSLGFSSPDVPHGSPASSPVGAGFDQNAQLTPRSKIRAMLSVFDGDDDSDKENRTAQRGSTKPPAPIPNRSPRSPVSVSDHEHSIFNNPRLTTKITSVLEDNSESDSDVAAPGNAYARIKQQLRKSSILPHPEPQRQSTPSAASSPNQDEFTDLHTSPVKSTYDDDIVQNESDQEQAVPPDASRNRFQELIARKRAEREAKEKEAAEHSTDDEPPPRTQPAQKSTPIAVVVESENSDSDKEAAKALTQQARPSRKASKKAIEEMRRETQRMSRNMQLAHEARTKTKYTTADLFKKFGFRQQTAAQKVNSVSSSSALPSSDAEDLQTAATPPSSPPSVGRPSSKPPIQLAAETPNTGSDDNDDEGEDMIAAMRATLVEAKQASQPPPRKFSVRQFAKSARPAPPADDSDDDLEILPQRVPVTLATLENMPAKKARESLSLLKLRALAHLNDKSPRNRRLPKSMTPAELQQLIHRKTREQNMAELAEKRERMKLKGGDFFSDEALEREQVQTHDLLEKARQENEELAKKEKEAAKRAGKEDGGDDLPDSEDEDEEYQASEDEDNEDHEISGSEDELEEDASDDDVVADDEEDGEPEEAVPEQPLFDEAAAESDGHGAAEDVAEALTPQPRRSRQRKKAVVDSDDEEDVENSVMPTSVDQAALRTPTAALSAAFGFDRHGESPVPGLSQVFGGTMAESQTQADGLGSLPVSPMMSRDMFPPVPFNVTPETPRWTPVQESQTPRAFGTNAGDYVVAQSQELAEDLQPSQMPAPTQDAGFEFGRSPARGFALHETQASHSTVDTVMLEQVSASPAPARHGRLQRGRARIEVFASQDEQPQDSGDEEQIGSGNAFLVMKKAAKRSEKAAEYNRENSEAKAMFEEQAEESEDEYAGLGGVSDDESGGEADEETMQMIDDVTKEKMNERRVAARYNEQRLAEDEKRTSKLFKDVTTGAWRRKRGAQDDFFDEDDDEDEASARRRAAKQREFAKMRKALLADEKIGKIAQNPKREAFLKAIEDFVPEHEMNFLDDEPEESQSQKIIPQSQEITSQDQASSGGQKRRYSEFTEDESKAAGRRTKQRVTSASVPDIRRTLSEMIGEPESLVDKDASTEDVVRANESEDGIDYNDDEDDFDDGALANVEKEVAALSPNPRRTDANPARKAVIDRMALKRGLSSATETVSSDRLAFSALSKASNGSFKVPSLLRRATTNASHTSEGGAAASMSMGKESVKMGGSMKSSVNYYVREQERRTKVEEMERHRKEGQQRIGRMRRDAVGLGSLAGGSFE